MGLFHVPRLRIRRGREMAGKCHRKSRRIVIIIIGQPLCPVVGRRPQHAFSKLACLVHSSARSCRSSICPGREKNFPEEFRPSRYLVWLVRVKG